MFCLFFLFCSLNSILSSIVLFSGWVGVKEKWQTIIQQFRYTSNPLFQLHFYFSMLVFNSIPVTQFVISFKFKRRILFHYFSNFRHQDHLGVCRLFSFILTLGVSFTIFRFKMTSGSLSIQRWFPKAKRTINILLFMSLE